MHFRPKYSSYSKPYMFFIDQTKGCFLGPDLPRPSVRSGYKINDFHSLPQVPAVKELLATTAACFRSFIAADDTTAVQELTPNGSGVALLQITM